MQVGNHNKWWPRSTLVQRSFSKLLEQTGLVLFNWVQIATFQFKFLTCPLFSSQFRTHISYFHVSVISKVKGQLYCDWRFLAMIAEPQSQRNPHRWRCSLNNVGPAPESVVKRFLTYSKWVQMSVGKKNHCTTLRLVFLCWTKCTTIFWKQIGSIVLVGLAQHSQPLLSCCPSYYRNCGDARHLTES